MHTVVLPNSDVIPNGAKGPVRDLTMRMQWHGRRRGLEGAYSVGIPACCSGAAVRRKVPHSAFGPARDDIA